MKGSKMRWNWVVVGRIATAIGAIGTLALAIGTYELAVLGLRQGSTMEDQLAVTRDQLTAMKVSNDNYYISQRPYINFQIENAAFDFNKSRQGWDFIIRIINNGNTATKDFRYLVDCSNH